MLKNWWDIKVSCFKYTAAHDFHNANYTVVADHKLKLMVFNTRQQ